MKKSTSHPRIIGLTASVTYAVDEKKINKSMQNLCNDLCIEEIATATENELVESGYHALGKVPEMPNIDLPFENLLPVGIVPVNSRKPHLMHQMFFNRIKQKEATKFSQDFITYIKEKESEILIYDSEFKSPLKNPSLKSWGQYAHSRIVKSPL